MGISCNCANKKLAYLTKCELRFHAKPMLDLSANRELCEVNRKSGPGTELPDNKHGDAANSPTHQEGSTGGF